MQITVTKILALNDQIKRSRRMAEIVELESLKRTYQTEACALSEALYLLLAEDENDTRWAVWDRVDRLAEREAQKKAKFEGEEA